MVLTGGGTNGVPGAEAIRKAGGVVLAQGPAGGHPATARHPSMPRAVIRKGIAHQVLPLPAIAPALVQLVTKGTLYDPRRPGDSLAPALS